MKVNVMELYHTVRHDMGTSVTNLEPAIHDGHFKKKFRSLAPLVQIL
jgi:hypothetical protein